MVAVSVALDVALMVNSAVELPLIKVTPVTVAPAGPESARELV